MIFYDQLENTFFSILKFIAQDIEGIWGCACVEHIKVLIIQ